MTLQWALAHAVCDRMGRGLVTVPRLWRAARLASQNGRPRGRGGSQPARPYTALGYYEAVLSAERFYTRCAAPHRATENVFLRLEVDKATTKPFSSEPCSKKA
jgi:hypothetical protein